jgi:hypothetical protein
MFTHSVEGSSPFLDPWKNNGGTMQFYKNASPWVTWPGEATPAIASMALLVEFASA